MISRYDPSPNQHGKMRPEPDGGWVYHTDHKEEINSLINKLTALRIENKALKQSRDELLEAFKKEVRNEADVWEFLTDLEKSKYLRLIQKAE